MFDIFKKLFKKKEIDFNNTIDDMTYGFDLYVDYDGDLYSALLYSKTINCVKLKKKWLSDKKKLDELLTLTRLQDKRLIRKFIRDNLK